MEASKEQLCNGGGEGGVEAGGRNPMRVGARLPLVQLLPQSLANAPVVDYASCP